MPQHQRSQAVVCFKTFSACFISFSIILAICFCDLLLASANPDIPTRIENINTRTNAVLSISLADLDGRYVSFFPPAKLTASYTGLHLGQGCPCYAGTSQTRMLSAIQSTGGDCLWVCIMPFFVCGAYLCGLNAPDLAASRLGL